MTRSEKTLWLCWIIAIGFLCAVFFHYSAGFFHGKGYPRSTFLFDPADVGNDFFNVYRPVRALDPYGSSIPIYFPFTYIPFSIFVIFNPSVSYYLYLGFFLIGAGLFLFRQLDFMAGASKAMAMLCLIGFSYPFLFCIDRANLECLVFLLLCAFVVTFRSGRNFLAALFLASAVAMKGYPIVFLVLWLGRRQIRPAIWTIFFAALVTFLAAAIYPGGITRSFSLLSENLSRFKLEYMIQDVGLRFNTSIFGLMKICLKPLGWLSPVVVSSLMWPYALFAAGVFSAFAAYIIWVETTLWKSVCILTCLMLLLPQVSFDYKMIHLLIPVTLFLREEKWNAYTKYFVIIFGLLFIPKAYVWLWEDINIGVIINPILLMLLPGLIVFERWPECRLKKLLEFR